MRLRTRIGLMFASGVAVIVLGGAVSWFGERALLDRTHEVFAIHERLEGFDALLGDLVDIESGARGFAITGEESYLEAYDRARERLPGDVGRMTALAAQEPARLASIAALLDIEARRLLHANEVVRMGRTLGLPAARAAVATGTGHALMNQARGLITGLRATEAARLAQLSRESERSAQFLFELIAGSSLAIALVAMICTLVVTRSITRPIGALAAAANRISQGEWPAIARERNDEIGDLTDAFSAMARARREAEQRIRVLIDHAPDAFLVADLQGRYIDANVAATELIGYPRDELIGMTVLDLIPPEDVPRLMAVREALLVAGTVDVSEWLLLRKDGTRVPVEVSAKILGDGRWQAFVRDISERKRAQAERERLLASEREHRRRLQTIREAALAISSLATASTRKTSDVLHSILAQARQLTHADFAGLGLASALDPSPRAWAWEGLSEAEAAALEARPLPTALTGTRRDRAPRVDELLAGGAAADGALPCHPAAGALLTLPIRRNGTEIGKLCLARRSSAAPFTSDDRSIVELLGIHAAVAIENAKLYDDVQSAVAAREDLLAMVSHDLRNPLNAILLREELLGRKRAGDRDLADHTRWVRRSVGNMHRMIQGLLDAASIDAGRLMLELEPGDLRAVIDEVLDALAPIAAESSVALECRVPDRYIAEFDRQRLSQVVYNLVGNAVKFTPAGGRIAITASASATELHVTVADTGRGIAPEVLPHIFERYFTTEQGRRGTGLGLHIAQGIVEAHGGRIWATSTPGEGATFHFVIPTRVPSRTAAAEGGAALASPSAMRPSLAAMPAPAAATPAPAPAAPASAPAAPAPAPAAPAPAAAAASAAAATSSDGGGLPAAQVAASPSPAAPATAAATSAPAATLSSTTLPVS